MQKLVLIKLGGSVITDKSKPLTPRLKTIKRLVSEIKGIQKKYKGKIIVGHGQGSFAHIPAAKYQTQRGIVNKNSIFGFCVTSEMAKRPNTILTQEFIRRKVSAVSFSPMSFIFSNKTKLQKVLTENIKRALSLKILPIVHGDVILDKSKLGFCIYSTEAVFDVLSKSLKKSYRIEKIIMVGDTDGVYDQKGKTITKINESNYNKVFKSITGSKTTDVTGGMIHKVRKALDLAEKEKIQTIIINGNRKGEIERAVFGRKIKGTLIN